MTMVVKHQGIVRSGLSLVLDKEGWDGFLFLTMKRILWGAHFVFNNVLDAS